MGDGPSHVVKRRTRSTCERPVTLTPMRPLRSLRAKLTFLFFAMTLAAVFVVYVYVTPQLESSLRQEKLDSLANGAERWSPPVADAIRAERSGPDLDRSVRRAADRTNTRVTLLVVSRGTLGLKALPVSDSTGETDIRDLQFALAADTARARRSQTGSESSAEGPLGQAASRCSTRRATPRTCSSTPRRWRTSTTTSRSSGGRSSPRAGWRSACRSSPACSSPRRSRAGSPSSSRAPNASQRATSRRSSPTQHVDELGQLARALDDMQTQLAELDSARKRFIATASHELRTPIFSLAGFLELLEDEELDEETRKHFIGQVREQVARLGTLATSLLDLSRLEAGSLELRPEQTDRRHARARRRVGVRAGAAGQRIASARCAWTASRSRRCATLNAWLRCCASSSTTPSCTPPRAPTSS